MTSNSQSFLIMDSLLPLIVYLRLIDFKGEDEEGVTSLLFLCGFIVSA